MREQLGFWIACFVLILICAASARSHEVPACDINGDGVSPVATDYGAFFASYNKRTGQAGFNQRADLDGNGTVTSADYSMLVRFCPFK